MLNDFIMARLPSFRRGDFWIITKYPISRVPSELRQDRVTRDLTMSR